MFDGQSWKISALEGSVAVLNRDGVQAVRILVSALLVSPGFSVFGTQTVPTHGIGPLFDTLRPDEYRALREIEGHLREVQTGFRSGSPRRALDDEPRVQFHPGSPFADRYSAKAAELGISVRTLRRRVRDYEADGLAGLIDGRTHERRQPHGRVDERWVAIAYDVLAEHVDASQPQVKHIAAYVNARATFEFGSDIQIPSLSTARRVLQEITRGQDTFEGSSAKQKRSIAARPSTPYGRFHANRVGQYILLDTSPLDVFAMDPASLRWINLQLTIAMDLATRCITGLRLSPVSANAVDAAMVLFETISPGSRSHTGAGLLPYGGIPQAVGVGGGVADGLPGTAPETIVIDHGKMYVSAHVMTVCERLGISVQPARKHTPTDKAQVERFFRTIRQNLLSLLSAYKGPDVYSRGREVEEKSFLFADELESIIREWVVTCYHRTPNRGLTDDRLPAVVLTPAEKWEQLTAYGGCLQVPARADLVYDFLPVAWRSIQHYGVEMNHLRYDGVGLNGYRNRTSPYVRSGGKWPIRFDPEDASKVFFQRPDDLQWSTLLWEHANEVPGPFSVEALRHARRLALARDGRVDIDAAVSELIERWDAGHLNGRAERRMALRRSERREALLYPTDDPDESLRAESAVERVLEETIASREAQGDDDVDDEMFDDVDFYRSALEVSE